MKRTLASALVLGVFSLVGFAGCGEQSGEKTTTEVTRPLPTSSPKELVEAYHDTFVMASGVRDPYMEDVILDLLIAQKSNFQVSSYIDTKNFVQSQLKLWLEDSESYSKAGLNDRLSMKLSMYLNTKVVPKDTALGKLIRATKNLNQNSKILVLYTYNLEEKKGSLCVRVPSFLDTDTVTLKSLSLLLELCGLIHGVSGDQMRIIQDPDLGKEKVELPSSFIKLVNRLIASAKSSKGSFEGPLVHMDKSNYKAYPVGFLSSMRLLHAKDGLLRRTVFKDSNLKPVTFFDLQQRFNESLGIKSEDSKSFPVQFLKASLASCVKNNNRGFPGGWIYSNRSSNGVKTDTGLVTILGWTEKVPSNHKLQEVIFNPVDDSFGLVEGKQKIIGRAMVNITSDGRTMSFQEFRTAVFLSCGRLDFSKPDFDEQLRVEPLNIKKSVVAENYAYPSAMKTVSLLNSAYALKVSLKNPKSKTSLVHYENKRNELLKSTTSEVLYDAKGTEYSKFSELPEKVQTFFRRKYRYPVKNKRDLPSPHSEEGMDLDVTGGNPTSKTGHSSKKTKTLTKGQATNKRAALGRKAKEKKR